MIRLPSRVLFTAAVWCSAPLFLVLGAGLLVLSHLALVPLPGGLNNPGGRSVQPQFLDRRGEVLNVTYQNHWNLHTQRPIHEIPRFLQRAFVVAEDKRFFSHAGVDWWARANALRANLLALRVTRGASTITEQTVRMLQPRPRTLWSRWLEGLTAARLEAQHSKLAILEFYLNQVPFEANRRGVAQAAAYYFDRSLQTLNHKEMLALAVIVRAPKWFDPVHQSERLQRAVMQLAHQMQAGGLLSAHQYQTIASSALQVARPDHKVDAMHYIAHVREQLEGDIYGQCADCLNRTGFAVHTTLDAALQSSIQQVLDDRLDRLAGAQVGNGGVIVLDHQSNDVLAWVSGYAGVADKPYNALNPPLIPRQPGSTLKPFVYAKALEQGWTAATMIDDAPLAESVGRGLHNYHNYSRTHYGPISVREALGNSLNVPAIKAVQQVGVDRFLTFLFNAGFHSLAGHPNLYGDGIALGNGEVTLLELTNAYATLARMGVYVELRFLRGQTRRHQPQRVLNEGIASLIGDILSDPGAREKEFGWNSVLNFPSQTAVKTGTSSDYRDAWAFGYNDRYTVGVWMGNLDYREMHEVTGSKGPALVLRSVFNRLDRHRDRARLYFSPTLAKHSVCVDSGLLESLSAATAHGCVARDEWFLPSHLPVAQTLMQRASGAQAVKIRRPTNGLEMAMDPRVPDTHEVFEFELAPHEGLGNERLEKVEWFIDEQLVGTSGLEPLPWRLRRGSFQLHAKVWLKDQIEPIAAQKVGFSVK